MKKLLLTLVCIFSLNSSFSQVYTLGTGAGTNTSNSYPSPYNNYWGFAKHQFLIRASELTALGAGAGVISTLSFNVASVNSSNNTLGGFTIKIKQVPTTTTTLNATFDNAGFTTVFGPLAYTPVPGWNLHLFSTCFTWDGTSNLLIDICYTSGASSMDGSTTYWTTALGFNASRYSYSGNCNSTGATTSTSRPNIRLTVSPPKPDAVLSSLISPASTTTSLGSSLPVSLRFKNQSCSEIITSAELGYKWNANAPVTFSWTGSLAVGATATYAFSPSITASTGGINILKTWVKYPNGIDPDMDPSNDTLTRIIFVNDPLAPPSAYEGTDFWLGFMANYTNSPVQSLYITSTGTATVTVSAPKAIPGTVWSTTVTVPANGVVTVVVPNTINSITMPTPTANVVSKTGVHIVSDIPVSVYGMSKISASTDGFLAIPTTKLGAEYIAVGPIGATELVTNKYPAEFMVVSAYDGTNVTIKLPAGIAAVGRTAGSTWSITLNQGETYLVQSNGVSSSASYDLTGTVITSSQPVAVMSGARCANIPENGNSAGYASCGPCDHLIEEMIPTSAWGFLYYTSPYAAKTTGDILRVISYNTGTTSFTISGYPPQTLTGQGAYKDFRMTGGTEINASQAIGVIQMCTASGCDPAGVGDPFMLNLIPEQQWGQYYAFVAPPTGFADNYVNIVKKFAGTTVTVDGTVVPSSSFARIGSTDYYSATYYVSPGPHIALGNNLFIAYIYGYNNIESYGYPASGAALTAIAVPLKLVSLSAKAAGKINILNWTSTDESALENYAVEKSLNGSGFEPIGTVKPSGMPGINSYSFNDNNPGAGLNYYRVKLTGKDGQSSYSHTVTVNNSKGFALLDCRPSPFSGSVSLSFNSDSGEGVMLRVHNLTGQVMHQQQSSAKEGLNELTLDLAHLNSGLYFISIQKGAEVIQRKIIKE
jgi:hypothetical protein